MALFYKHYFILLFFCAVLLGGHCQPLNKHFVATKNEDDQVNIKEVSYNFINSLDNKIRLGATWYLPKKSPKNIVVLMIPGSGFASRLGTKEGDGIYSYQQPIDLNDQRALIWAKNAGFKILSFDKRTCSNQKYAKCFNNEINDIDQNGISALSNDLDQVCNAVLNEYPNHKLVLLSSDQAGHTALLSKCVKQADLLIWIAPIPYDISKIMTDGLQETVDNYTNDSFAKLKLKSRASTLAETFKLFNNNAFAKDTKVLGASTTFWNSWILVSNQTSYLIEKLKTPLLLVLGQNDRFLSNKAKIAVKELINKNKIQKLVTIPYADRNLLITENIDLKAEELILEQMHQILSLAGKR
jgi:hypothetical protein